MLRQQARALRLSALFGMGTSWREEKLIYQLRLWERWLKILLFILKWVLRNILREHVITGEENVIKKESSVFVCNHSGIHGPIAMELFFPYEFRPWVISDMVSRKLCRIYMERELFSNVPLVAKPFCKLLVGVIEPVVLWIMREVNAIPVYKGTRKIMKTLDISVDALVEGSNVAIFLDFLDNAESNDWSNNSGFVHLAKDYYSKCGKIIHFYPVHIDRKRRKISIGTPIAYIPQNSLKEEKERVMAILAETIRTRA